MLRMKESIKKKWIKALRSGKYKQAEGQLRINDSFCCLGVLCDLYQKEKKKNFWNLDYNNFLDNQFEPPVQVLEWLVEKLSPKQQKLYSNHLQKAAGDSDTYIKDDDCKTPFKKLTRLNDLGSSFDDIADYLEKRKTL